MGGRAAIPHEPPPGRPHETGRTQLPGKSGERGALARPAPHTKVQTLAHVSIPCLHPLPSLPLPLSLPWPQSPSDLLDRIS